MNTPQCPYCASEECISPTDGCNDMLVCRACGAWFVFPSPSAEQIALFYSSSTDRGIEPKLRVWRSNTRQSAWYAHLASRIAVCLGTGGISRDRSVKVVDVGAGDLELTHDLARVFPRGRITALDLHPLNSARLPTEIADRVSTGQIDLNRLGSGEPIGSSGEFDVVACVSVIEHVLDPFSLLSTLFRLARPGGLIYVVGPDVNSLLRKLLRSKWPYYCPQAHLTLPTRLSIALAVARVCAGTSKTVNPIMVRYSAKYLLRYLGINVALPRVIDVPLPLPVGAFELIWRKPSA